MTAPKLQEALRNWVDAQGGPSKAARALRVSRQTLYEWLNGLALPHGRSLLRLHKVTGGEVHGGLLTP
jgi:DNA-binding phage protein